MFFFYLAWVYCVLFLHASNPSEKFGAEEGLALTSKNLIDFQDLQVLEHCMDMEVHEQHEHV